MKDEKNAIGYLLGLILVVFSSIWKYTATDNIMVDNNPVIDWQVYPILALFIVGLILNLIAYYKIILTPYEGSKKVTFLALSGVLISAFMFPMLSNDMTLYMAYGELANKGVMAYANGNVVAQSAFYDFVSFHWQDCPNHYGPPLLLLFTIAVAAGKTMIGSLLVFKGIHIISSILFIYLTFRIIQFFPSNKFNNYGLIVLAPVFWLQGIGQMHVDNIIMTFIAASLFFLLKRKFLFASVFIALIVLSKSLYLVVFLPLLAYFVWYHYKFNLPKMLPKFIISIGLIVVIVFASYKVVWEGKETITATTTYHENKGPSKSHVEIVSDLVFYGKQIFGEKEKDALTNVAVNNADNDEKKLGIWRTVTPIFKFFGILLGAWAGIGLFFVKDERDILHIFGKILIAVVCFYSPIFHPWYFLLALPFFIFTQEHSWVLYICVVFSFSNFHEVMFIIPRDNPIYFIVIPLIFLTVASFWFYFKRHFILETLRLMKENSFVLKRN